ncbi:MAG TPA: RcpC/CpaB family pilus assembly protein [Acidimicrobiales bacterium]|nr:RcpC/CpaB family pilus assembly protein [Acidimicrobiales bacterium]
MQRRANVLVLVGVAVVLIGGVLLWSTTRDSGGSSNTATVPVLVATSNISQGTTGDDLISSGHVAVKNVPVSQRSATALSNAGSLSGQITIRSISKGEQIGSDSVRTQSLRAQAISIPKGKNGVAVTLPFTAAGGGYAGAGDVINLYTYQLPSDPGSPLPVSKLLVSNVTVLDVSQQVAPAVDTNDVTTAQNGATTPRAEGQNLTYLLALTPEEAEHVVFATSLNHLYFTIVAKGNAPASTSGVQYSNQLPKG